MQEKLEYQLEERTRDMQELLLTCQTKVGLLLMYNGINGIEADDATCCFHCWLTNLT